MHTIFYRPPTLTGSTVPKNANGWIPKLKKGHGPVYKLIADAIGADIATGRLVAEQRLPAQRSLADALGIDFTTVARAYTEAQKRGLVDSPVGRGTFVCGKRALAIPRAVAARPNVDLSMNMPPEALTPELMALMRSGLSAIGGDMSALLRYQDFGGSALDREAGALWLRRRGLAIEPERLLVVPGAQAALMAILSTIAPPGSVVCCESLTYPGLRALASLLNLRLVGLPMDGEGIDALAFAAACAQYAPQALYCNPTLLNPTTLTMSAQRRQALVQVARNYGVPIIEDDAYGFLPRSSPPPIAAIGADVTYYVAGMAKCVGAGLRLAYIAAPDAVSTARLAAAVRATTVMAAPFTAALASRWIREGTADLALNAIRKESMARQRLAARILPPHSYASQPEAFHLWIRLPEQWDRLALTAHLRATGIGVVPSDAFAVDGQPPQAIRVCIGGIADQEEIRQALQRIAEALQHSPLETPAVL
ncbi:aminotransferase class I/II-fold pyridoxal phosphate-dependent enzyme [Pseudoduganella sp. FT25W]|uniref:Aminotransferase class I/II-fold pyridoxal phosphate-dependent enzyme n=1 Tax=Duganella alba TaxID=2666081 RepID=A0A6L5QC24_9BURK|nr:PLP-dependent aminotransferase family protein [Duganella alba]MRX06661.1 aminotransferase class I/II-fold pyridoxal phosphate-dependent enzyme [Duganella alba]MRX17987.1 aminotransferase class I/II-fold pyridoxal phosphate-dependent enzyme [Duganella alba]